MLSYSNFGSDQAGSPLKVHEAVAYMQQEYPELAIDGEMQVNFAMNRELRDSKYPSPASTARMSIHWYSPT